MKMNKNEAIIFSYECTSEALINIADYIESHDMTVEEIINLLREGSENIIAQSKVVELREELRTGKL